MTVTEVISTHKDTISRHCKSGDEFICIHCKQTYNGESDWIFVDLFHSFPLEALKNDRIVISCGCNNITNKD